jgi:hypothetical protein
MKMAEYIQMSSCPTFYTALRTDSFTIGWFHKNLRPILGRGL